MLKNSGNYSANNTASRPSRTESSTDLRESQLERKISKFSVEISRCFMLVIYISYHILVTFAACLSNCLAETR
jgi:hypothetical protein